MASTNKFEEMAGLAFENALRLHIDSARSYHAESFATAYQLSITASEELGKALLLQEYVFQTYFNGWNDVDMKDFLINIFSNHRTKQRVFAHHANDFLKRHHLKNASALINPLIKGVGELDKQNSTYVGLTRTKTGKVDLNGRIIHPRLFAQPHKAKRQITLNSDFLQVYTEGFLRAVYGVDVYSIAALMDEDMLEILRECWAFQSRTAKLILQDLSKHKKVKNPLSDWE